MKNNYRDMLNRAYEQLPEQSLSFERFNIPRAIVHSQGRRSVISNFKEIADELRRSPDHLLNFFKNETATRANFDGTRAIFQGRFNYDTIRNLLEIYTNKYVICPVCNRPDTQLVKERRLLFLQCEACGARSSVGKS